MHMKRVGAAVRVRAALFGCTAIAGVIGFCATATAQTAPPPSAAANQATALGEVVVTAQKREQNLQQVPVADTALTPKILEAHRIAQVMDLNGVVPNLRVHLTAGGTQIPNFDLRGVNSYGVVPGSDKEVSLYLDGVYIAATRGSTFELPDIDRIEVLRGPQGTLFGRNATGGAVSIVTPNPTGQFDVQQGFTYGNYNQFRAKTRIDFPKWGPFSVLVSYLHDQRDGDIKNLGAGTVWNYSGAGSKYGNLVSPATLGANDSNVWFAAVKFQPTDRFTSIYKFDYSHTIYTPEGVDAVGLPALFPGDGEIINNSGKRPDAVNNWFSTPSRTIAYGNSLTSTYKIMDGLSLKNITAYRYTYNFSAYQLDGRGGVLLAPGLPVCILCETTETLSRQFSTETQVNYDSKYLTLTGGFIYLEERASTGGLPDRANLFAFLPVPGFNVPIGPTPSPFSPGTGSGPQLSDNYQISRAEYLQAEIHITPQLDLVGGLRTTLDHKKGTYFGYNFSTPGVPIGSFSESFNYRGDRPAYLANLNYKLTHEILLYAKYSSSFVSGGQVGSLVFAPETAYSYELGGKADFLEHRLRTNLALFDVTYDNIQSAQAGLNVGHPELGTVVTDQGNSKAKGFELEVTALPIHGLTLNGSVGYTDLHYTLIKDNLYTAPLPISTLANFLPTLRPKWTTALSSEYVTKPVWGDARLRFRLDGDWRSSERIDPFPGRVAAYPNLAILQTSPASWIVDGRVTLEDVKVPTGHLEIAVWAKNIFDNKSIDFADIFFGNVASTNYEAARTFGMDVNYAF